MIDKKKCPQMFLAKQSGKNRKLFIYIAVKVNKEQIVVAFLAAEWEAGATTKPLSEDFGFLALVSFSSL